ncbi:hypothetical protein ZHAS_00011625 [Anopheles sinensis]|uniref:Uncharacterized protein n=1 Tax=Anopheles sinensis TaxID=74873 RepID=A0A084W0Z6_ANOSI|nr:hypothetical protein ZHAS_00011625 [Anopheles sinensis]
MKETVRTCTAKVAKFADIGLSPHIPPQQPPLLCSDAAHKGVINFPFFLLAGSWFCCRRTPALEQWKYYCVRGSRYVVCVGMRACIRERAQKGFLVSVSWRTNPAPFNRGSMVAYLPLSAAENGRETTKLQRKARGAVWVFILSTFLDQRIILHGS